MTVHTQALPDSNHSKNPEKTMDLTVVSPSSNDEEFGIIPNGRPTILPPFDSLENVASSQGFLDNVDNDDDYLEDIPDHMTNSSRTFSTEAIADSKTTLKKFSDPVMEGENKAVSRSKWSVVILILLTIMTTSATLYWKVSEADKASDREAFVKSARIATMAFQNNLNGQLEAMSAMSSAITTFVGPTSSNNVSMSGKWLGTNISDIARLGCVLKRYTESYFVATFANNESNASGWESDASQIVTFLSAIDTSDLEENNLVDAKTPHRVRSVSGQHDAQGEHLVRLEVLFSFPQDTTAWNYNFTNEASFPDDLASLLVSQQAIMGSTVVRSPPLGVMLPILFPILDSPGGTAEGMIVAFTSWNKILSFPKIDGCDKLIAVVEQILGCSPDSHGSTAHSFALEAGTVATYLVEGQWHDHPHDSVSIHFEIPDEFGHLGTRVVELASPRPCNDTSFGPTKNRLVLYPAEERDGRSSEALLYSMIALAVGAAILVAFGIFDWRIRRRHALISNQAIRSRELVSSLFPANVHERLLQGTSFARVPNAFDESLSMGRNWPVESPGPSKDVDGNGNGGSGPKPNVQCSGNPSTLEYSDHDSSLSSEGKENSAAYKITKSDSEDSVDDEDAHRPVATSLRSLRFEPPIQRLRSYLTSELPPSTYHSTSSQGGTTQSTITPVSLLDEPIADLFPECTVIFADIAGFTAWSSVREPAQVFKLLETLYSNFDRIAKRRGVFKVETIGDCYVAVTGLPEPQSDHAVIMSKFATESMQKMMELVKKLEMTLGPDTGDLCMRCGLHSGPITAGVLRGEKSRFQLFGDTVNFASRMESTGIPSKIQCSQATADLLKASGKQHWVFPREKLVTVKGKGMLKTYFISLRPNPDIGSPLSSPGFLAKKTSVVQLKSKRKQRMHSNHEPLLMLGRHVSPVSNNQKLPVSPQPTSRRCLFASQHEPKLWHDDEGNLDMEGDDDGFANTSRQERLVDWNVEILADILRHIVAHRQANKIKVSHCNNDFLVQYKDGQNALDEITEIISLGGQALHQDLDALSYWGVDPSNIILPKVVEQQLRDYVSMIACMYRDNPFHNFEHASHVLNSVQKLLKRVMLADREREDAAVGGLYTTSIASDPLTQFSIVLSALIHDVDHSGVPNGQLIKEEAHVATLYNNKSVAEQNSLDLAFELLMDPGYEDLQRCIFCNKEEFHRFRQLLVNVVIATDIFDKDMKDLRNKRWEKAFQQESLACLSQEDEFNLKGTIVLEYIMQASDVSHTMQHWHVYKKWNQRLFEEMYTAFLTGRGDKDPSAGWYKGELWFFDNYVIPLAKKLKECRVFGAASDECLNYAISNRKEWEEKGEAVVAQFIASVKTS